MSEHTFFKSLFRKIMKAKRDLNVRFHLKPCDSGSLIHRRLNVKNGGTADVFRERFQEKLVRNAEGKVFRAKILTADHSFLYPSCVCESHFCDAKKEIKRIITQYTLSFLMRAQ